MALRRIATGGEVGRNPKTEGLDCTGRVAGLRRTVEEVGHRTGPGSLAGVVDMDLEEAGNPATVE